FARPNLQSLLSSLQLSSAKPRIAITSPVSRLLTPTPVFPCCLISCMLGIYCTRSLTSQPSWELPRQLRPIQRRKALWPADDALQTFWKLPGNVLPDSNQSTQLRISAPLLRWSRTKQRPVLSTLVSIHTTSI